MEVELEEITTEVKNVPALRFPEFGGEWHEKRFGNLYSFKTTNSLSRDKLNYDNGEVKNIHYGDIHTKFKSKFDITKENVPFINSDINLQKTSEECYLKEGDLVIADASEDYNDIGKCIEVAYLNGEKVLAGLHTFLARREVDLVADGFASLLMQSRKVRLGIMLIAQGTKVLSISTKRLAEIPVFLPSTKEQKKIASFLNAIDDKIQQLTKKIDLLERYKKGVIQQIFTHRIRFKGENGQEYPEWQEKKLVELLTESRIKGSTGDKAKKLTVKLWGNGVFEKNEAISGSANTQYYIRKSGQFIYSKLDFLNCAFGIIPNELDAFESTVDLPCFDISTNLNSKFLLEYVKQKSFYKKFGDTADGSRKAKRIHADVFLQLSIQLPSIEEQNKISCFLKSIENKINLVTNQLEQTKQFKKGLLQQMFV
ncbi:restriction endonuclease subunit S [Rufibacter ruber]|uniref:restriction endonuclease subunit S n=1 Tax=Rufibacter ruber TaxID=1783499 RepID=UPI00082EF2A5|nr:restriction endonuclease subunit S [Rufibacter ruber]